MHNPTRLLLFVLLVLLSVSAISAQTTRLAQQYYQDGEYEKAAQLYQDLYEKSTANSFFLDRYISSLVALRRYEEAETVIKQQLKREPDNSRLYVSYGELLAMQDQPEAAAEQYERAIVNLPADQYAITRLANAFLSIPNYELAATTYERGGELLRDPQLFSHNLGDLYRRMGDTPRMIENYLNALNDNVGRVNQIKTLFQRYLSEEEFTELQSQLYLRIQDQPDNPAYPEFLAWVFVQRKDYLNALRQVRALDRRLDENGIRIYQLASIAADDRDYDAAIEAYNYIVDNKGPASTFYIDAKREALRMQRNKLVEGYDYNAESLGQLRADYLAFLQEFGRSRATAGLMVELAELEALYLNDLPAGIALLNELIALPGVEPAIEATAKLQLGDYHLMRDNVWESTLLYSQVDKLFKDDQLGHEARYRNARLSYFSGDFQWAQAQFDVLKASTSKLIANDALDLSVFIMDNLGLDTTAAALQMYADAELLVFQNKFAASFDKLDSLLQVFPDHELNDDVLYLQAKIYAKQRNYTEAAAAYQRILDDYSDGIRADNACFALASLYENSLDDIERAKELYQTLFIDYSGSTFAVEARKRFRLLRGDKVQ